MKPERDKNKKPESAGAGAAGHARPIPTARPSRPWRASLDDATACQLDDEFEAERAEAEAQTAANELADALAAANARAEEYLNLAQRVQADFDNYRRRNQNTRSEAFRGWRARLCRHAAAGAGQPGARGRTQRTKAPPIHKP